MKQPNFLPKQQALNQTRIVPSYIQNQCECELCAQNYNLSNHTPMMICQQQHNCCLACVKDIIAIKKICPFCRKPIVQQGIRKNRMISKIIQEVAKKKGITLQVYERPQQIFHKKSQRKQVVINDPIEDHLIIPPQRLDDVMAGLLAHQNQVVYHQSCISKFCRKIQLGDGLFCFTYFLTLIYNLPFLICEMNYAVNLQEQNCMDNDYGAGMTVRQWLFSSSIIGLSMYGITWLGIMWKLCCFHRKKCPQRLMILNLILFFLKFVGWNIYGIVVISSVNGDDTQTCDSSLQSYMEALLIIQIVVICGICSQFDKRR